jgi:5'-phosphate synthase pdxT subunit
MGPKPPIGVLALQGGFPVHAAALTEAGAAVREVRKVSDLEGLAGIVLPGGESTVQSMLIDRYGLREPLTAFCKTHPVMATCAGLILLALEAHDSRVRTLGLLDLDVERNAYGSQRESFTETLEFDTLDGHKSTVPGVFIRAPRIKAAGEGMKVLARKGDDPVAILAGRILAMTFHPELAADRTIHRFFLGI